MIYKGKQLYNNSKLRTLQTKRKKRQKNENTLLFVTDYFPKKINTLNFNSVIGKGKL